MTKAVIPPPSQKPPTSLKDYNGWAIWWYYIIGVNVIPAKTRIKKTFIRWKEEGYQTNPIPEWQLQEWIDKDEFKDGMAVVLGNVYRGDHKGEYLTLIDLDNLRAIDEFCGSMKNTSLTEIAQKFIVEQHKDNTSKAHILFYSATPFAGKPSDAAKFGKEIRENMIPGFEIKGLGTHGIVFCTPSSHQNGEHYEIIGILTPPASITKEAAVEMMHIIDEICKKYGLHYLDNVIDPDGKNKSQIPMTDLYNLDNKTTEGNNRHERELRLMDSLIITFRKKGMPPDQIKQIAKAFNQFVNVPPKDDEHFEQDWKDAMNFVTELEASKELEELLDGCVTMEQVCRSPETYTAVVSKDDYENPTTHLKQPLRTVQEIRVERGRIDKAGNPKPTEYQYRQYLINAIPVRPIEIIYDPLFEITKYKIRWEYVGPGHKVVQMEEPVGPYTKEELKDWLIEQNWVYKTKVLDETLSQVIKAYSTRNGMAKFSREIETEGLIWLAKENRLVLSKLTRYKPTPEEAGECIKVLLDLQKQFYQSTPKRPLERKRFAHFIKIGIVAPIDFARRQCGAVENHKIIPRQDLGGVSHVGKTHGYAGLALRLYRLPLYGKTKYVIGSGSVETEARLIHHTKVTTMPVILDDADFLTEWQRNDQSKRCLSLMKYAADNTNPRNILSQDSKALDLPLCAYTMPTHNSDLIDEDGWITRSNGHEYTKDDQKTEKEEAEYQNFMEKHAHTIGYLGDFAIDYYLEHSPQILFNDWLTIAKTILHEFFVYAGKSQEEITAQAQWLMDEVIESATSQDKLAEDRTAKISAAFHDIIQNQGWVRNKHEAAIWICKYLRKSMDVTEFDYTIDRARAAIDNVKGTATFAEKVRALIAIDALPNFKWHPSYEVCIVAPIIGELKKHDILRVSHTQLPSYCEGFEYDKIYFGLKQVRAVYTTLDNFVSFINSAAANTATE